MRNKLSFDLQLSARKAAIAERIAAHKIARSKVLRDPLIISPKRNHV